MWTWVALDAESKLVPCWLVGPRDVYAAREFVFNLSLRNAGPFQLTSDGLSAYPDAVERVFGREIDYAALVNIYGVNPKAETRYSPAQRIGARKHRVTGKPDLRHISTISSSARI